MSENDVGVWFYWLGALMAFIGVAAGWGPIPATVTIGAILMLFSIVKAMVNK